MPTTICNFKKIFPEVIPVKKGRGAREGRVEPLHIFPKSAPMPVGYIYKDINNPEERWDTLGKGRSSNGKLVVKLGHAHFCRTDVGQMVTFCTETTPTCFGFLAE
jgi:hypothetical protein